MTDLPARSASGELAIEIEEAPDAVRLVWSGKSRDRDPAQFLAPLFARVLERVRGDGRRVVLDFRAVDYMNSSTFPPVLKLVDEAKQAGLSVTLEYATARRWQELSFSALRAFETPDGRIRVHGS